MASNGNSVLWEADDASTARMPDNEEHRAVDPVLSEEDLGGAVDVPRSVDGAAVALTLRQNPADPRKFRLSSRANEDVDCAAVCALFGGGGHKRAAGATVEADTPEEAFAAAVEAFSAIV